MGCHALLQGIFATQGWNPRLSCLLHGQAALLHYARVSSHHQSGCPSAGMRRTPKPDLSSRASLSVAGSAAGAGHAHSLRRHWPRPFLRRHWPRPFLRRHWPRPFSVRCCGQPAIRVGGSFPVAGCPRHCSLPPAPSWESLRLSYESQPWPSPPADAPSLHLGLEGHSVLGGLCLWLGLLA